MPYLIDKFFKAKDLRKKGYSLKEISVKLKISKSTASVWLKDFNLSSVALKRLEKRKLIGSIRTIETKKIKREKREKKIKQEVAELINSLKVKNDYFKIFCSLLYICEGAKNIGSGISFCNSDPLVIKVFLFFLRRSFSINESKFRVSLHIHDYHSAQKQISFWSKITNIPKSQFIKPYKKPHTKKRVKNNYQGCVNVRYHDSLLAKKLYFLGIEFLNKYGGVG